MAKPGMLIGGKRQVRTQSNKKILQFKPRLGRVCNGKTSKDGVEDRRQSGEEQGLQSLGHLTPTMVVKLRC